MAPVLRWARSRQHIARCTTTLPEVALQTRAPFHLVIHGTLIFLLMVAGAAQHRVHKCFGCCVCAAS
jgi:hypothetical protein